MRVALDTNILAYAEGVNGAAMKKTALDLVEKLPEGTALLPVQTLGELFNLLVRKAGRDPANHNIKLAQTNNSVSFIAPASDRTACWLRINR